MAHDESLADRIRALIGDMGGLSERKMFGGHGFLLGGNLAVSASGQGGLLVRVDPGDADALVSDGEAEPMVMRGRTMRGWLRVDAKRVTTDRELARWVERGTAYAASLPAKR